MEEYINKVIQGDCLDKLKEYTDTDDASLKKELEVKCGKFLTEEILENTQDNVGLIEQV